MKKTYIPIFYFQKYCIRIYDPYIHHQPHLISTCTSGLNPMEFQQECSSAKNDSTFLSRNFTPNWHSPLSSSSLNTPLSLYIYTPTYIKLPIIYIEPYFLSPTIGSSLLSSFTATTTYLRATIFLFWQRKIGHKSVLNFQFPLSIYKYK